MTVTLSWTTLSSVFLGIMLAYALIRVAQLSKIVRDMQGAIAQNGLSVAKLGASSALSGVMVAALQEQMSPDAQTRIGKRLEEIAKEQGADLNALQAMATMEMEMFE